MKAQPLITIVVPVHNRETLVTRTLDSIKAQNYRPLRVILVDNDSTDGTPEVLKSWAENEAEPDLQIDVTTCETPGAAAARNVGLKMVESPWVMFFDSDDTMTPDHVARAVNAIEADGNADVIGWKVRIHRESGKTVTKPFSNKRLLYNCILHGTFATQRYICRTELITGCGGWDENVFKWNDIELGTRLLTGYPDINVVKLKGKPTVDVYESPDSITGASYYSRSKESEHAIEMMSRVVRPYQQYMINLKRIILAANYKREGYKGDAKRLKAQALSLTERLWHSTLLRFAYIYTASGGRGISRLIYRLF